MDHSGARIRAVLTKQGRIARWLADGMGISESYLSKLLDGRRVWSPELRAKVAERLGVPEELLFFDADCAQTNKECAQVTQEA